MAQAAVSNQRAYGPRGLGRRVAVERLWPQGLSRERTGLDLWLPELAPSAELRRWYGQRPERWEEFARRYRGELGRAPRAQLVGELLALGSRGAIGLLDGAGEGEHSEAAVLSQLLRDRLDEPRSSVAS